MAVDAFPQPLQNGLELTPGHEGIQVAQFLSHGVPDLGREQVPQGIGGEVTKGALGPVDILQHALRVIGGNHTQVGLHLRVPGFGQVGHLEVLGEQSDFQLEAQDDVEVVGDLIGFHPDEGGFHPVERPVEGFGGDVAQVLGEGFLHPGEEELPEGPGASDQVLPESRLGFVDAQGGTASQGQAFVLGVNALVVQGVAHFV